MTERERPKYSWAQKKAALARQLRPYRSLIIGLSAAEVVSAVANGLVPLVTGKFFDSLVTPHSLWIFFGWYPAWAIFLTTWAVVQALANGIGWIIDRATRELTTKLEAGVQASAFIKLLTLPVSFHKNHRAGEITENVSKAGWMLGSLANTILTVAPQLMTVVVGVAISFLIRPSLALVLLAGLLAYLVLLARILPRTSRYQEEGFRIWNKAYGDGADAYANVGAVKQAGAEDFEAIRIRSGFFEKAVPLWYRMERAWSDLNFSQRIIVTFTQAGIFLYSVYLVGSGAITIGDLIAFNGYAGMIVGPFVALSHQWQTVQNGLVALARAEVVFGAAPENYEPSGAARLADLRGEVAFEEVHFSYGPDQAEVLKGVSFTARAGQAVALVGETGVGKSTTVDLVSGYYFATAGRVLVDGYDITKVNLKDLRARMAVVPQEVVLFNTSIADNIRYGRPDAPDEEVREAARKAHADAFIEKFPKGYDQEVGERGVKLSVGQKQRVAIARAILREPRILILDEPTSALDPETEQYISKALEELMKGRTTFIVAHRLSTVRKADLILVLKDGMVAERGTHDELIAIPDGIYRRLYELHIGLHE